MQGGSQNLKPSGMGAYMYILYGVSHFGVIFTDTLIMKVYVIMGWTQWINNNTLPIPLTTFAITRFYKPHNFSPLE